MKHQSTLTSLAIVGVLAVGLGASTTQPIAAQRSGPGAGIVAGGPVRVEIELTDANRGAAFSAAARTRTALGFPGGSNRIARHVRDGFQGREYDEVEEVDTNGRSLSITQFDGSGRLVAAARFDAAPRNGTAVTREAALKAARRGASAAGLGPVGSETVEADEAEGGWAIHWRRSQDGVPVRGDEVCARVRSDGKVRSLARVEHQLAAAPASRITSDQARQSVGLNMNRWFAENGSGYAIGAVSLQWVDPNNAFDPAQGATPNATYRLAWVVDVTPSGPAAEYVQLITLYVDAGNGNLIGGDLVE